MQTALHEMRVPERLGGHLALDFINTVDYHNRDEYSDYFRSYRHLVAWCWRADLLSEEAAQRLERLAAQNPQQAELGLQRARELRRQLYQLFHSIVEGRPLDPRALEQLNARLNDLLQCRHLTPAGTRCSWTWETGEERLEAMLGPVLLSATELLTSTLLPQLGECPNCGWLFLDTSRNRLRRWCSMRLCGSKIKSRRQYERRLQKQVELQS